MGATSSPILTAATTAAPLGEAILSDMQTIGALNMITVPFSFAMSASYATGGDTLTLPTLPGWVLHKVCLDLWIVGANMFVWNGSASAPKILALTALPSTQVGAATNLSTTTLIGSLTYFS